MIKVTDFIHYYSTNFQLFFEGCDMLEYEEDVLNYILNESFTSFYFNSDMSEIKECVALNIRQYFQDNYSDSSDVSPEDAENDAYEFIYQYDILEELWKAIKDEHVKYTTSNGIKTDWSEDNTIEIIKINNDIYLDFTNTEVVKYTDVHELYNSKIASKKGKNTIIDLNSEFVLFQSIVGTQNDNDFFKLVEYYIDMKEKDVYVLYKDYCETAVRNYQGDLINSIIPKDLFGMVYRILDQPKIKNIKFNGWLRDTYKIRSTDVV